MKAVIFDIDGTLLENSRAHKLAFSTLFKRYGIDKHKYNNLITHGMTDRGIVYEVFRISGFQKSEQELDLLVKELSDIFMEFFEPSDVAMLPGVADLLKELSNKAILGIGTGNCKKIALARLAAADLHSYFKFGSFGDNFLRREEMLQEALSLIPRSENLDIFVIGDTPKDIDAAKKVRATAIAVATGNYTVDQLADADLVVENFSVDRRKIINFILNHHSYKS
ncbi:HAD family hydrolase [Metallosphaera javensis (ex Sakai et al. 2022)]|uniref:HAD family hydrolase n=1 Tax=Metallosphaera javensis (ex Sakai et al. 2022) TaxID=2775498 RepID=UPI002589E29A|nr:MAG: phosphoglycolate phosphatase [Metallosphaera javensis (ex Sakai et al. 2022)]